MGLQSFLHRQANKVFAPAYLPRWKHLGGERIALDGKVSATLPQFTEIFALIAEGGDILYSINTLNASAESSGYVPQNGGIALGPLSNLVQLSVYGNAGTIAHLLYFRETR